MNHRHGKAGEPLPAGSIAERRRVTGSHHISLRSVPGTQRVCHHIRLTKTPTQRSLCHWTATPKADPPFQLLPGKLLNSCLFPNLEIARLFPRQIAGLPRIWQDRPLNKCTASSNPLRFVVLPADQLVNPLSLMP